MRSPDTKLDTRFSDADAVATGWEETRRVLEQAELFWISTVRADGRPHVTPLVAVWLDDAIYFATGPGEQKAVNLRTNQHVILTTGCNQWEARARRRGRGRGRPGHGRGRPRASRRGVGDEVGRTLALRSARRRLPARGWNWCGPGFLGDASQDRAGDTSSGVVWSGSTGCSLPDHPPVGHGGRNCLAFARPRP